MLNGGILFAIGLISGFVLWSVFQIFSVIQIQKWCENPTDTSYLYLYLSFSMLSALCDCLVAFIQALSNVLQGRKIHKKIMECLLHASFIKFFNRVPMGRILNRLSKDL